MSPNFSAIKELLHRDVKSLSECRPEEKAAAEHYQAAAEMHV